MVDGRGKEGGKKKKRKTRQVSLYRKAKKLRYLQVKAELRKSKAALLLELSFRREKKRKIWQVPGSLAHCKPLWLSREARTEP